MLFSNDTDLFRQYVPVNVNFDMISILPTLEQTESALLSRFLDSQTLEALLAMADEPILSHHARSAVQQARMAVANLAFFDYLPFAEVQIDDDGITVSAASGRKPAFDYQTKKLARTLLERGWSAVDRMIGHIAHPDAADDFPDWVNCPYYATYSSSLFRNPAEFSKYYDIGTTGWLTFWALRPYIDELEDSRRVMEALAAVDQLSTLPVHRERLRRMLCRAVALQVMLASTPNLTLSLSQGNVQINYASQYSGAYDYFQPPDASLLAVALRNLSERTQDAWFRYDAELEFLQPPPDNDTDDSGFSPVFDAGPVVGF